MRVLGRGACGRDDLGWRLGWAGLQRTEVSEAQTRKASARVVMPSTVKVPDESPRQSIDTPQSTLRERSMLVSDAQTAMAGANAAAPSGPSSFHSRLSCAQERDQGVRRREDGNHE